MNGTEAKSKKGEWIAKAEVIPEYKGAEPPTPGKKRREENE